jgi:hypothetical protein
MRSTLILFSLLLAACAPEIQYRVLPLDRPERPVLPKIKAQELTCIAISQLIKNCTTDSV